MLRILFLALSCTLWMWIPAAGANSPGERDAIDGLTGQWKLDWEESESMQPAMSALEVPWLIRQMAGFVTIQVTIERLPSESEAAPLSLRIVSENPIKDTSRIAILDGVSRPFTDPLGNQSMDWFRWRPDTSLKMVRNLVLKSGKVARIQERWIVEEDPNRMLSIVTVWIEDVERASVRRSLMKVSP